MNEMEGIIHERIAIIVTLEITYPSNTLIGHMALLDFKYYYKNVIPTFILRNMVKKKVIRFIIRDVLLSYLCFIFLLGLKVMFFP